MGGGTKQVLAGEARGVASGSAMAARSEGQISRCLSLFLLFHVLYFRIQLPVASLQFLELYIDAT